MAADPNFLSVLAAETQRVYERNAARFDAERSKQLRERVWLDRFAAMLPPGGAVLDAGCGAGDPIAAYFTSLGHHVTGIDAAQAMIKLARERFPDGDWLRVDMRRLCLERKFDGVIGRDSFFHLTQDEQRATLVRLADHLAPTGVLMLTVGPVAGEVAGHVGDDQIYHSSLSPSEYETILTRLGLRIVSFVSEDPECDFRTVLLARRQ